MDYNQIKETDFASAASLIDGEGCVFINKMKGKQGQAYYNLRVILCMTDRWALDWMVDTFGGRLSTKKLRKNYRREFVYEMPTQNIDEFLRRIVPYSRTKHSQVCLAYNFRQLVRPRGTLGKRPPRDPLVVQEMERMCQMMKDLKREPQWWDKLPNGGLTEARCGKPIKPWVPPQY